MRRGHLIIIFVTIFMGVLSVLGVRQYKYKLVREERVRLEEALTKASDVAVNCLADGLLTDTTDTLSKVSTAFFTALSENLYWYPDEERSMETSLYVPLLVVTAPDGFYLCLLERTVSSTEGSILARRWTECYPYTYQDSDYIYRLYLDGRVRTVSKEDGTIINTSYKEVKSSVAMEVYYKDSKVFLSEESFKAVQRSAVASSIEERVSVALAEETYIAGLRGINVSYTCPEFLSVLDDDMQGSFLAIYQGMPSVVGDSYYFSGVRTAAFLKKKDLYYVEEPKEGRYYSLAHRKGCMSIDMEVIGPMERDMAVETYGAYGCPDCLYEYDGFSFPP